MPRKTSRTLVKRSPKKSPGSTSPRRGKKKTKSRASGPGRRMRLRSLSRRLSF